jgi:hypothetical protein
VDEGLLQAALVITREYHAVGVTAPWNPTAR